MFTRRKNDEAKDISTTNVKLTKAEKKQLAEIMARNTKNKKEKSAQESIPYERLYPDGICKVSDTFYSKTVEFSDINYLLSEKDDKTAIFDGWCDFLNFFDPQINFQLSFLNLTGNEKVFEESVTIKEQDDDFNSIRHEYSDMLLTQLSKGNNGILKRNLVFMLKEL